MKRNTNHSYHDDFPLLSRKVHGKRLIYLDSTATSLKPYSVLNKEREYYEKYCANVFRGIYSISEEATAEFESARKKIGLFINCIDCREIVFTRNTSESLNLLAYSIIGDIVGKGDEILCSVAEHHSNFVPWQQLGYRYGVRIKPIGLTSLGEIDFDSLVSSVTNRTKIVSLTAVSNVLGCITPVSEIAKKIKKINPQCLVIIDAAQAVPHMKVDCKNWGVDAIAFSSHKMMGPTGIGVLWAKYELLEKMRPYQFGGEMIREVHENTTVFQDPPMKFEAGTPHIAGVIGLGAAVDYISAISLDTIRAHEIEITSYALTQLSDIPGVHIIGPTRAEKRGGVIAFTLDKCHPHDIASLLNEDNICIRAGYHCAQVLHEYLCIGATARISFYIYTQKDDIDIFIRSLQKAIKILV